MTNDAPIGEVSGVSKVPFSDKWTANVRWLGQLPSVGTLLYAAAPQGNSIGTVEWVEGLAYIRGVDDEPVKLEEGTHLFTRPYLREELELARAEAKRLLAELNIEDANPPTDLQFLRTKLKTGEYDGADIMAAWIAIDELIAIKGG